MSTTKKYYWLHLFCDYFNDIVQKKMRKQENGLTYQMIYLKLMLLACGQDGIIYYRGVYDSIAEEISDDINESVEDVNNALRYFEKEKLLEYKDYDCFIPETLTLVGSETDSARRMRKHRKNMSQSDKDTSQCDNDVTMCDTEKETNTETDIKTDIKTDSDIKSDSETQEDNNNVMCQSNGIKLNRYGKYENVYLPKIQYDLLSRNYSPRLRDQKIEQMSEYLHKTHKTYQDYYSKLKEWIEKDYSEEMIDCEKRNTQSYPIEYDLAQYYDESKPPYYGFPEEFFTDGVFDENRVRPILQKRTPSSIQKGHYEDYIISVDEIKHRMKLILYFKNNPNMFDSESEEYNE